MFAPGWVRWLPHPALYALLTALAFAALPGCSEDDEDDTEANAPELVSKYVYAAITGVDQVTGYELDRTTGELTALADSPWAVGDGPAQLCTETEGRHLFVVNGGSDDISVFEIDSDSGDLIEVPGSPFATGGGPSQCQVHPDGEHLYNVISGDFTLRAYSVESAGTLDLIQEKTGVGGDTAALNGDGSFYVVGDTGGGFVHTFYVIPGGGGFANTIGSPINTGGAPRSVLFAPESQEVYVANDDDLYAYSLDADTGALTEIHPPIGPAATNYTVMAVDPSGKHLYASIDASILTFEIGDDGGLSAASPSSIATTNPSLGLAFDLTGTFLFKTTELDDRLVVYERDASTGELVQLASSPYVTGDAPAGVIVINQYR